MPSEPLQDARGRYACPTCGSMDTQAASAAIEDRIRNAIAAHWAEAPGPRGPDARCLRGALIVWAGLLALALVTSNSQVFAAWEWAAALLGAMALGVWLDRRVAHRRGWIDPLQRTAEIVRSAQARDAVRDAAPTGACGPIDAGGEFVCLQCGHRFVPAAPDIVSAA